MGMNACSYCQHGNPVKIDIVDLDLRICPSCLATYLPAKQFAALRREVFPETRKLWLSVLKKRGNACPEPTEIKCIDHGTLLAQGEIPDYGYPGAYPTCCEMQHLAPTTMIRILEFGLALSETGFESQYAGRKPKGISAVLGGILFRFFEKKAESDGLETMQYNYKFREALGALPDEVP